MNQKHAILTNFVQHAAEIPEQTANMEVVTIGHLTVVNSGLPCDTFNTIHVQGNFTSNELEQALEPFQSQNLPFCLWISQEYVNDSTIHDLQEAGLHCQAEEAGMILDLTAYEPISSDKHQNIRKATSPEMIREFSQVIANNWSPPDQEVINFYEKTAPEFIQLKERVSLLSYYQDGEAVATVEVFATDDQVVGIHGLATLEDTRGHGIGSALMTKVLNEAKAEGYLWAVLLATSDGAGIYQKLGFQTLTTFYEYA
ncbi:MAG: GNAT family N-acetyltransferase [Cytophagales bacterium]|nr:GNAT family N-acetyltransferase [Cytophagales bacterium]